MPSLPSHAISLDHERVSPHAGFEIDSVHESTEDIAELQSLLDRSIEQAGPFLHDAMELEQRSLSSTQIIRYLEGLRTVSLATVTARGEPRVAPITAMFVEARYVIPTVLNAARSRHLRKRPGVSLAEYAGNAMAIIIHGQAELIDGTHDDFQTLDDIFTELSSEEGPASWGGGGPLYIRVQPHVMYATAQNQTQFPE